MHVIEPAFPVWALPMMFDLKKDGSLWLWVDYRKLSAAQITDAYTVQWINEYIDSPGKVRKFSPLDASPGFWQIKACECDHDKTACTLHHWLYRLICMMLSLKKATRTSQGAMDEIISIVMALGPRLSCRYRNFLQVNFWSLFSSPFSRCLTVCCQHVVRTEGMVLRRWNQLPRSHHKSCESFPLEEGSRFHLWTGTADNRDRSEVASRFG